MSALSDLFALFVSDDKTRPSLLNPFEINGKVYDTNGYGLIRCDKVHCDFEIMNTEYALPNNVEALMPDPNNNLILNIDKSLFDSYDKIDKEIDIGVDIECELCDGTGEVEWECDDYAYTKMDECPACYGDGLKEIKKLAKTGKQIYKDLRVKLGDTYFKMDNFYKLIKVRDALGGDITLRSQTSPTLATLFSIGFCDILLMPVLHNEKEIKDENNPNLLIIDLIK